MKRNQKKVFALALAACLLAVLSAGSLAWFTDTDSVTNQFMIADSASTPDAVFSVDVWEYANGDRENRDQDGAVFENILPGSKLHKQPYVENTGAYDQYIRVHVTVTNADAWIAALGNGYDLGTMFGGHDESLWTRMEAGVYNAEQNTYTMTFYLNGKLAPKAAACLFTDVTIPGRLTREDMVFIGGQFALTILAEAVQTENLGVDTADDICDAYQAFQAVGM